MTADIRHCVALTETSRSAWASLRGNTERQNRTGKGNIKPLWNDIAFCFLPRLVEHIFDKNAVARGGIVDEHMGNSSYDLSVLDDRAARHECGQ